MTHAGLAVSLATALLASAACRKAATRPGAAPPASAPNPAATPAPPPHRPATADELEIAKEAGLPINFASCQTTPGSRTAVWSCGLKKTSQLAHDPALRPCAPLIGHDPDEEWGIGQCALIYWDPGVKLPATWDDCKTRFIDEPAVVHVKGQELCMVFVSFLDASLYEQCRKMPFSDYREGFCRYPLAGPNWTPRSRAPLGGAEPAGGGP